jgi:DNA-binding GntR family transcriptional regulator
MSKPSTSSGRSAGAGRQQRSDLPAEKLQLGTRAQESGRAQPLEPLTETLQLGTRAYHALVNGIIGGQIEPGTQLRPDLIAEQLEISVTPVREALHRLEGDGLVVKLPYHGWFVREFTEQEVRELYALRAVLEAFGARLACQNAGPAELAELRAFRSIGEDALRTQDMDAYRLYNRDLHAAIIKAAGNSYLSSMMGQLALQSQMLMNRTIRLVGRPSRAIEEHHELVELIANGKEEDAASLMQHHILSALEDIVQSVRGSARQEDQAPGPSVRSYRR